MWVDGKAVACSNTSSDGGHGSRPTLNGGLVAGWMAGSVPAAGRSGAAFLAGTPSSAPSAVVAIVGVGLVTGGVGFLGATEKHRRDARSSDLPAQPPRVEARLLTALSAAAGAALLAAFDVLL